MRLLLFLAVPLFAQTPCAEMARQRNVTAATQTATYCRVSITLRPAADSEIKSEVWLPAASVWNGKLLMEGGGGLVGSINTAGMTNAIHGGLCQRVHRHRSYRQQWQVCTRPSR
jgi:hypothetical protein